MHMFLNIEKVLNLVEEIEADQNKLIDLHNIHWDDLITLAENKDFIKRVIKEVKDFKSFLLENKNTVNSFKELSSRLMSDLSDLDITILSPEYKAIMSSLSSTLNSLNNAYDRLLKIRDEWRNSGEMYTAGGEYNNKIKSVLSKYGLSSYYEKVSIRNNMSGMLNNLKNAIEKITTDLWNMKDALQKATQLRNLISMDLGRKIDALSDEYFKANEIINSFDRLTTTSATTTLEYLKDYERRITENEFKTKLQSLNQLTNNLGGAKWIIDMLDQINIGKKLFDYYQSD